jgi:4-amino-4-deoxy-L-arabinose transferase-like glycosyltransferase
MRWFRPHHPERGPDGLPVSGRLERRLAFGITVAASVWFALAAAWEMFGPLLAGHYAASASVGIMAENTLRWRILGPVWEYTASRPPPSAYYCHHPWGIFWTEALLMKLLGRHDYLCRLPAVLLSSVTPPLLFALGRALWRPAAGAVAAAAFTVLPICLAFANFNGLEVPVMAWSLCGLLGFVRHTQTGRRRHLALSLAGFTLALHADWPAYVLCAELLAFGLVRGLLLRRWPFGRVALRPYAQWWALCATCAALTALLYVYLFHSAGGLPGLLDSYRMRAAGADAPFAKVLASRRYWLELCFTPIAIVLGALAAVVCSIRLLVRRYDHEILPLALFGMATVQYVAFKQGADIHVFWPHYFAAFFALGMGALADSGLALGERLGRFVARRRRLDAQRRAWVPLVVVLVLCLGVLGAILRDGIPALRYARGTGGRFNEKGLFIESDGAKTAVLAWLARELRPNAVVGLHDGMKATWAQVWTLGGRVVKPGRPVASAGTSEDAYVAYTPLLSDADQQRLASEHHVRAVGPVWIVTRGDPPGPLDAYSIVEREPRWLEGYLRFGTEPVRSIVPDPYATWELRTHFAQPAEPPRGEPTTLEERRIAHNVAQALGDTARAAALAAEIGGALAGPRTTFEDGTELVGCRYQPGVQPLLTLVLRAPGPIPGDVELRVRSRVVERAPWSTTMADPAVREVALPLGLSPKRWRAGWLYSHAVVIRKRPGTEAFDLTFRARRSAADKPAAAAGARSSVEVLRLP